MPAAWRLIGRETVVDSPWFRLHRERLEMGNGHVLDPFWSIDAPQPAARPVALVGAYSVFESSGLTSNVTSLSTNTCLAPMPWRKVHPTPCWSDSVTESCLYETS